MHFCCLGGFWLAASALSFISRKQSLLKWFQQCYFYSYNVKGFNYNWVFGIYTHPFTMHIFFALWDVTQKWYSFIYRSTHFFLKCQLNAKSCPRRSSLNSEDDCTLQNEWFFLLLLEWNATLKYFLIQLSI